jgi:hypothetical protein
MNELLGQTVGYIDYCGTPRTGKIVYASPHKTEPDIAWFGLLDEKNPELNNIPITFAGKTGQPEQIIVAAYIRSDECYI